MRLEVHNMRYGYPTRPIGTIDSMCLEQGVLNFLIGSNGVGKSTLMRTMARIQPSLGDMQMRLNDIDLTSLSPRHLASKVSYLHTARLSSRITVEEFMHIGLGSMSIDRSKSSGNTELIQESCARIGAEHLLRRFISTLSDGEYQKILVALVLARDTPVMLLDEPLSHLDPPAQLELMSLFKKLSEDHIILLSTHHLEKIPSDSSRILVQRASGDIQDADYQNVEESSLWSTLYI